MIFRDITTLLKDAEGLKDAVDAITASLADVSFDLVLSPESRGFIFGMPVAYNMGKGFVPVRKAGKLPAETISKEYELEYGTATIEIHKDAIKPGQKVVIVDDLMATGDYGDGRGNGRRGRCLRIFDRTGFSERQKDLARLQSRGCDSLRMRKKEGWHCRSFFL